ncbi:hypothetical protein ACFQY4_10170 [Catellatospora bangladeshensis]|uniref:hypothetical protein n=1 Tax=Catellatospora bangladeshensis TaxID=310355 RepID=UPI00360EC975
MRDVEPAPASPLPRLTRLLERVPATRRLLDAGPSPSAASRSRGWRATSAS